MLGIGRRRLGKSQPYVRLGKCASCGTEGQLAAYTTTEFIVAFSLPLVALSEWRLSEECPACGAVSAARLAQWLATRTQVLQDLRPPLSDSEAALDFLETAQVFFAEEAFEAQAAELRSHFAEDSEVLGDLGNTYSFFRHYAEAEECIQQARAVEDSIDLRCLAGLSLLREGRPQEAQGLFEEILSERDADLRCYLYLLVEGYQLKGEHSKASEVLEKILTVWPDLAHNSELKRYQKRVQSALGGRKRVASLYLEAAPPGPKGLLTGPIARFTLLPLLLWYLFVTISLGQARPIYLVNGLSKPYDVEVEGKTHHLLPSVPELITVVEGTLRYSIVTSDTSVPSGEVEATTSWLSRPFTNEVFVVNPDQTALLVTDQNVYSKHPNPSTEGLQMKAFAGQALYRFSGIDVTFADFPEKLTTFHHHLSPTQFMDSRTVLTRLWLPPLSLVDRVNFIQRKLGQERTTAYLGRLLQVEPGFESFKVATDLLPPPAALALCKPHLDGQPVQTNWHRLYQDAMSRAEPERDLTAEYRQRLSREPDNHELQYLLGRLLSDPAEARKHFQLSIRGRLPCIFGYLALANEALVQGSFAEAERLSRQGLATSPQMPDLQETLFNALWAQGRWPELLALEGVSKDARVHILVAAGRLEEARKLAQEDAQLELSYAQGKLSQFSQEARAKGAAGEFLADLVEGKVTAAADRLGPESTWQTHLLLYLVASQGDQTTLAQEELAKAVKALKRSPAASMLEHPADPAQALAISLTLDDKRVFLAAMALRDPAHRERYCALARKLNFDTRFPYWTVRQVVGP